MNYMDRSREQWTERLIAAGDEIDVLNATIDGLESKITFLQNKLYGKTGAPIPPPEFCRVGEVFVVRVIEDDCCEISVRKTRGAHGWDTTGYGMLDDGDIELIERLVPDA